jgi:hypothetical protein
MDYPRTNSLFCRVCRLVGMFEVVAALCCSSAFGQFYYSPISSADKATIFPELAMLPAVTDSAAPEPLPPVTPTPQASATPPQLPAQQTPADQCRPLPPVVGNIYGHRSSILPRWTRPPLESPLLGQPFVGYPVVTRPIIGPPLLNHADPCEKGPLFVPPPADPGYMRSLTRYGVTAPIPPAAIECQAPPWQCMPSPAELKGATLQVGTHKHDPCTAPSAFRGGDFSPEPYFGNFCWDPNGELAVYGNKHMNRVQRPAIEWGLPFYDAGMLPRSGTGLGLTNLTMQKFYVYGDFRSAVAYNQNIGNEETVWGNRLNLEFDYWITATERFHMFMGPVDDGNDFTGLVYDDGKVSFEDAWDAWDPNTDTLFFEGDLGYILGGWFNQEASFNLPFAAGLIPLVFQNGVWIEDAFVGMAATIPARNNPWLDWSNYDTTFFIGFDQVTSNIAFENDNQAANIVGFTTFIESKGGYLEAGYAFLDDSQNLGRSYHNVAASYTRRYLNLFSNSVRAIANTGQGGPEADRTADGLLLLMENSFLTRNPYNVIPYVNLFAGFGHPQSAARLQGPLKNTGINFESDLLTGYPTLDDTGNNTYGAAIGLDLLGNSFEQQLMVEAAVLQTMGSAAERVAPGDEYGLGVRYQKPLSHTLILRADAMYGFIENANDITGARIELRRKF